MRSRRSGNPVTTTLPVDGEDQDDVRDDDHHRERQKGVRSFGDRCQQLHGQGNRVELEPQDFTVKEIGFARAEDGTYLAAGRAFFSLGGPEVTVFTYHDKGNVPVYSWAFLGASVFGFIVHLPWLDRAEKKRRAILTGGAAPPWYGPA